ncbi:response regulator transcription factor [Neobacillus sp. PS3-12]|jgi:DNA-binding NarL/FixJ family response regulator|uniref:response regulator transcription factor n=1 Tax=Neobacillus sp. PS3-12 TaxID=3070677 RepID=UPI0027E18867|nr:response regulator transcription factor [Neobacillus sp. PS3-12]WML50987.1 response regulator transcription factor [Neobacillus sp. PS3-12]
MINILIADDQELMRDGLATILNLRSEINVAGTAKNGQEAFEKAKELGVDLVLMDIRMPNINGVEGTKLISKHLPNVKVLMLTTFKDSELIFEALEEGASGYLLKDMPTDTIVQAIMTVYAGGVVLPPELTTQVLKELKRTNELETQKNSLQAPNSIKELTEREREVLVQLGHGCSNKEMADKLFITEGTVKNHVSNIISKLELRDRTQAAIFAVRYGITTFET